MAAVGAVELDCPNPPTTVPSPLIRVRNLSAVPTPEVPLTSSLLTGVVVPIPTLPGKV
jgi:hypothetical protein